MEEPSDPPDEPAIGLLDIPVAILEQIVCERTLQVSDVLSLSCCAKHFEWIRHGDRIKTLWKMKFNQQWFGLIDRFSPEVADHDYCKLCRICSYIQTRLRPKLEQFARNTYHHKGEIPTSESKRLIDELISPIIGCKTESSLSRQDLLETVEYCLQAIQSDSIPDMDLTIKFHAVWVNRYVRQEILKNKFNQFRIKSSSDQSSGKFSNSTLLHGCALFSDWFNMYRWTSESVLNFKLDSLAHEILERLTSMSPNSGLARRGTLLDESEWDCLSASCWPLSESRLILKCINYVLYDRHGFSGNEGDYYATENSFIDSVLDRKTGIPITLCIIYKLIAARLGVHLEPVNSPGHFMLRWDESDADQPGRPFWTYIDPFRKGKTINCPGLVNSMARSTMPDPLAILRRMSANLAHVGQQTSETNLLRIALELSVALDPAALDIAIYLGRVYAHLGTDIDLAEQTVQESARQRTYEEIPDEMRDLMIHLTRRKSSVSRQEEMNRSKMATPKKRPDPEVELKVEFAVGMIMRHRRYEYNCVIYDWDTKCEASQDWIIQMGVNNLPLGPSQPFYHVLVHDGTERYAAQENLMAHTCEGASAEGEEAEPRAVPRITHQNVGKYFESFTGTYYAANERTRERFPDDESILKSHLSQHQTK